MTPLTPAKPIQNYTAPKETKETSYAKLQAIRRSPFKLSKIYRFQYEPVRSGYVLLFPEGIVELNETASLILSLCLNDTSLMELFERLENKFPDAPFRNDVEDFLLSAFEEKWLEYTHPL